MMYTVLSVVPCQVANSLSCYRCVALYSGSLEKKTTPEFTPFLTPELTPNILC